MTKIGILHPGEMGVSVASSAINSGHEVYWVPQDRSDQTRLRAEKYHLREVESLTQFCQTCEIVISICPPYAAEDVARSVLEQGFKGYYLDANAISPQQSVKIGEMMKRMASTSLMGESSADRHGSQKRRGLIYQAGMLKSLQIVFPMDCWKQRSLALKLEKPQH